jgi:hypothetical protein
MFFLWYLDYVDYSYLLIILIVIFSDNSSASTTNHNLNEDDEQTIPVATQANKCRPRDVEKKTVSLSKYNLLLQEKKALENQVKKYKSGWMRKFIVRTSFKNYKLILFS